MNILRDKQFLSLPADNISTEQLSRKVCRRCACLEEHLPRQPLQGVACLTSGEHVGSNGIHVEAEEKSSEDLQKLVLSGVTEVNVKSSHQTR